MSLLVNHTKITSWTNPGVLLLAISFGSAIVFFADGLDALLTAWSLPEYSHGPLIPVLSLLLFLRQLKEFPIQPRAMQNRWFGFLVVVLALFVAVIGKLSGISDLVAYAAILWIGGIVLVYLGWATGKHFWPPVVHLVYMLPLPGVVYYKMTTWLQFISSEMGVFFLRLMEVPVFLDGNIIDLGVVKLHVAEACSGLRYLFPILSFSYIFAVLYKGNVWHKAILLISAAPITVLMNSVRIAIAGYIVNSWGSEWVVGFSHFFEGWVIFVTCIIILFALARILLFFDARNLSLAESMDLETQGLLDQALRVRDIEASKVGAAVAVIMLVSSIAWQIVPNRDTAPAIQRESFTLFPRQLGEWEQLGLARQLSSSVEEALGADDYLSVIYGNSRTSETVELFSAWYADQTQGGVHSPEICLPGGGWEIAWLERSNLTTEMNWEKPVHINRAIIQKGEVRMMVYYWFEQKGRKIAWDMAAKYWLLVDGVKTGRTDGALVRLTTRIGFNESEVHADERLKDVLRNLLPRIPRFFPPR